MSSYRQPTSRTDRGTSTTPATNHGRNDPSGGPSKSKSPLSQEFQTAPDRHHARSPPTQSAGPPSFRSDKGSASGSHGARSSNSIGSNIHISDATRDPSLARHHAESSRLAERNIEGGQGIERSAKHAWLDAVRVLVDEVTDGHRSPWELSRSNVLELMAAAHESTIPDDEEIKVLRIVAAEYRGERETAQRLEREYHQASFSIPWSYEPRRGSSGTSSWYIEDGQPEDV